MEYYKNLSLEDLFYINDDGLVCCEEWRDVVGYEGYYMISDLGRIKSLSRIVKHYLGSALKKEMIKKINISGGYCITVLCKEGIMKTMPIYHIVAESFLGHKFDKSIDLLIDHKNNNSMDSRLINLQLITYRENLSKDRKGVSGFKGVFPNGNNFVARININGKLTNLGTYKSKQEAHNKYLEAINNLKNIA